MNKQHIKLVVFGAAIVALTSLYIVPVAFSQEDMTHIPVDAFGKLERPQAAFQHDLHNEKAELDDCVVCHHSMTEDGKRDMEMSSEGEPCESCHAVEPTDGKTPLMRAYHRQCIDCHKQSLKGPVACGECHKK